MPADTLTVNSAVKMRKIRQTIRTTLSLVAGGSRTRERPGPRWQAKLDERIVEWTPSWPWPPYSTIDDRGILYLTAHESGHLKWTGRYKTTLIKPEDEERFHRFCNAIEDVRVDRLSHRQYANFMPVKLHVDKMLRSAYDSSKPTGWSLVDTVAVNSIYSFDLGETPMGDPQFIEIAERVWPQIDRIANTRSTQEVATGLEPIFLALREVEEALKQPPGEGEGEGEGEGGQGEGQPGQGGQSGNGQQQPQHDADPLSTEQGLSQPGAQGQPGEAGDGESSGGGAQPEPQQGSSEGVERDSKGSGGQQGEKSEEGKEDGADGQQGEGEELEKDGGHGRGEPEFQDNEQPGQLDPNDSVGEAEKEEEWKQPQGQPKPDPLAPLDKLDPNVGQDELTDSPHKSDGKKGTEPMSFGDELQGMAQDATTQETVKRLHAMAGQHDAEKAQNRRLVGAQMGHRAKKTPAGEDTYKEKLDLMKTKIGLLSTRLRTVLQHNAMDTPKTGKKRGRLDSGKAWRAAAGNPRIFSKPGQMGGLDYTFGLLVDTSGSMFQHRFVDSEGTRKYEAEAALEATVLVAESLEKVGLGCFIILWDAHLVHFKPVAEKLAEHRGRIGNVFASGGGPNTIEAPALSLAIEEMSKVRSGKKMLITITDGNTTTIQESKQLLDELEHLGVAACTIRIGDEPASHYKNGFQVEHAGELASMLPKLINKVVKRGGG